MAKLSEFERSVLLCLLDGNLDIQTDSDGQLVIYTNWAETLDGELVEFDLDTAEAGLYRIDG